MASATKPSPFVPPALLNLSAVGARHAVPLLKTLIASCTSRVTVMPRGADCAVACTVILVVPAGVPVVPLLDPLPLWQPSRIAVTLNASAIAHAMGTRRFRSTGNPACANVESRRRSRHACKINQHVLLVPRFPTQRMWLPAAQALRFSG